MSQSKNRESKSFYRIFKLSNLQIVFLVFALVFMCYLISRQVSVILKRQDLHYKVYKTKDKDASLALVDSSTEERKKDEEFRVFWDGETVSFFESLLGVADSEAENKSINCILGKEFILTGLPGPEDTFEDYIWQYLSLEAISLQQKELKPFVTVATKTVLDNLFDNIAIPTINLASKKCYNLKYSIIVGNRFPLHINHEPETTPYLLEQTAKRYVDVVKLNMEDVKRQLSFKKSLADKANKKFLAARKVSKMNKESDINYVGLYVGAEDNDKIPIEFFRNAMTFHRKLNPNTIFIVICDQERLSFCQKPLKELSPDALKIVCIKRINDYLDFVIMASCNNSIVTNTMGAVHALFNGGDTITVYQPSNANIERDFIPFQMSKELPNWYPLG